MKSLRKVAFLMMVVTLVLSVITPFSASAATPRLNNTHMTNDNFFIKDGVATVAVAYTGYSNLTTGALVTIQLQRKSLLWWSDVCTWTISFAGWTNSTTKTTQLSKTGEYRAIIEYTISGSGGADDVFSVTLYDEY